MYFSLVLQAQGLFEIVEVFPNTLDDKNLEYIILKNVSEESKSLSGYILADKRKEYYISKDIFLDAWEKKKFLRTETKIVLNNTNEVVKIISPEWDIIHEIEYKSSLKWALIRFWEEVSSDSGYEEKNEKARNEIELISDEIYLHVISDEADLDFSEENIRDNTFWYDKEKEEASLEAKKILQVPEVIFSLQRPSYIEESKNKDIFICDGIREECKVNFDLRKSFLDNFSDKDYKCEIDFWFWKVTGQEERCNPNTITFPSWVHNIIFSIYHKSDTSIFSTYAVQIHNNATPKDGNSVIWEWGKITFWWEEETYMTQEESKLLEEEEIMRSPEITLNFQRPSYIKESRNKDVFMCDETRDECKINFDLRDSFFEEFLEKDYVCQIDFWFWKVTGQEGKCNPNTVIFPQWEHEVIFHVFSKDDKDVFSRRVVHILNIKQSETIDKVAISPLENEVDLEDLSVEEIFKVPEVKLSYQVPSYVNYSTNKQAYICDKSRDDCKINFDFRGSFSHEYLKKDYSCKIDFWFWKMTWEEDKCNPNTVIFPAWEHQVVVHIYHKDKLNLFSQKVIRVSNIWEIERGNKIETSSIVSVSWGENLLQEKKVVEKNELHIFAPKIIVQSWLEWSGRYYVCKKDECSINLNYEKRHSDERCLWDFWSGVQGSQATHKRCNPWYVYFEKWIHELSLRVYEKNNESNKRSYVFYVYNIWETLDSKEKSVDNIFNKTQELSWDYMWRKGEGLENTLYDATIILQGKIGKEKEIVSSNELICHWVEKCYVNFNSVVESDMIDIEFVWLKDEEIFSEKQNPKWIWLNEWEHNIMLQLVSGEKILKEIPYYVEVENIKKIKNDINYDYEQIDISQKWFISHKKSILSKTELKKIFTQNFLVLKYDGLRISWKAPIWSEIEIYIGEEKILSWVVDQKWKYRLVSSDFEVWIYTFNTKIILETGEEIFLENSGKFEILENKIQNWISEWEKVEKDKAKKLKKIFTQNFLVLKYDWLRISGKAPEWSRVDIYLNGKKVLSWLSNEKWKYRIVTKSLKPGAYTFDTQITYPDWKILYISKSWRFTLLSSKMRNWFTQKTRKSSSQKTAVSSFPKLILETHAQWWDLWGSISLSLFRKFSLYMLVSLLLMLAIISLFIQNIPPSWIFLTRVNRLQFRVKHKLVLVWIW